MIFKFFLDAPAYVYMYIYVCVCGGASVDV